MCTQNEATVGSVGFRRYGEHTLESEQPTQQERGLQTLTYTDGAHDGTSQVTIQVLLTFDAHGKVFSHRTLQAYFFSSDIENVTGKPV